MTIPGIVATNVLQQHEYVAAVTMHVRATLLVQERFGVGFLVTDGVLFVQRYLDVWSCFRDSFA